ncbi:hypothetical protein [Streptomyces sp. NPDC058092]|uniref:hypothetical protein n=1 Tax=Streptomyces sp. NPDC058092 TaxID=3346336 RepID=UPI0036E6B1E7
MVFLMGRVGEDHLEIAVAGGAAAVLGRARPGTVHAVDQLSRYDGLSALRLNPLGAHAAGLAGDYAPAQFPASAVPTGRVTVLANFDIVALDGGTQCVGGLPSHRMGPWTARMSACAHAPPGFAAAPHAPQPLNGVKTSSSRRTAPSSLT